MNAIPEPFLSRPELLAPDRYPNLGTVSPAMLYPAVLVPRAEPPPPEFVFVPVQPDQGTLGVLGMWNLCWEWGHLRPDRFRDRIPEKLRWLEEHPGTSFRLVAVMGTSRSSKIEAYAPLHALLPLDTARRFGLEPKRAMWPVLGPPLAAPSGDDLTRLSRAFAYHVWPYLSSRSRPGDFSHDDPLRILSHSLDFWLPYVDVVAQRRAKVLGRVDYEDDTQRENFVKAQAEIDPSLDADYARPCFGGDLWSGEDEARDAMREMIELADAGGRLRGLIDAVRSHRVQDDFSSRWSFEREDFERKLYSKRAKKKVVFVELDDTVPVHSIEAEVDAERRLIWQDFFSVLDEKERRVVVCLRSGATTATEIAGALGFANHSPISKALARIRKQASKMLL